jgi:hypothetical protein
VIRHQLHPTETSLKRDIRAASEATSGRERPGGTVLSFSKPLLSRLNIPAAISRHPHIVDPQDPASLLMAHVDALDSLRDYAQLAHVLATELIGWRSRARVGDGNIGDIQAIATIAELEASRTEAYRHALEPWLDYLRDQDR